MIPMTLYPQSIPETPPEYFVARCAAKHIFIAPLSYQGTTCPVCEHQGRPYVPPDQYPCRHCEEFPRKHAPVEQRYERTGYGWTKVPALACLFSPTRFEPMTQAELELRAR